MAAKHSKYSKWGLAAIGGGVAFTAIEVVGAVSYLVGQASPSYLVAGGALVTVVVAILPILAARCWHGRRYLLALMLWAAMVPALSLVFSAAVERTGSARDEANRDRQAIAQRIELARAAVIDAKADVEAAEAKAAAECSRASKGADPRGPLCRAAEDRAEKSRERLRAARDAVAQAGVVRKDSQAVRLAAILPVSEESDHLAGCDLGLRAVANLSRCPSAEPACEGGEAEGEGQAGAEATPRQRPAAIDERGTPAASSLITPPVVHAAGVFIFVRPNSPQGRAAQRPRLSFCDTSAQAFRAMVECKGVPGGP